MQTICIYGRVLARCVFSGYGTDFQRQLTWREQHREFHLVTAASGLSKTSTPVPPRQGPTQPPWKWKFGDDACFIADHTLADVLGVADGVGGWRSYGIDPSVLPTSLMKACERLVKMGHFKPHQPTKLLEGGYREILQDKEQIIGSCTACIVALNRQNRTLYSSNLGDSGFLLVRAGKVVHRSEEQQHTFNTPFQLTIAPSALQGMVHSDSPESADQASFDVQAGDLLLLGSDGLFDNMNDAMILVHLSSVQKDACPDELQQTADKLAQEANLLAFDPDYMSPFAKNATAHGISNLKGGKPDDITILLAQVKETGSSLGETDIFT